MKTVTFYYDPISPFAWLAFQRLPEALMGDSTTPDMGHRVAYKPVLFAALLRHHGQLGPAEIPAKRDWTYRHVQWLGHSLGVPLAMPAAHPFNPLPLLRLALACTTPEAPGETNRYTTEQVLRHVWEGGGDPQAPERLAVLQATLAQHMAQRGRPLADPGSEAVKQQLRANTEEAIAAGAFGVPSFVVDGKLFWGLDGLPLLRACLQGDAWFDGPGWHGVADVKVGVSRLG
ncbi:MAG: 2-hydroxychromene-2-carboxylate isomerase [Burkholderiaceae bacterium]